MVSIFPGIVLAPVAKVWGGGVQGIKQKSVVGADEDTITIAVEAAQKVLKQAGVEASEVGALYAASVSNPYAVKSMAALVAEVAVVPYTASLADFGGSTRAGTAARVLAALP